MDKQSRETLYFELSVLAIGLLFSGIAYFVNSIVAKWVWGILGGLIIAFATVLLVDGYIHSLRASAKRRNDAKQLKSLKKNIKTNGSTPEIMRIALNLKPLYEYKVLEKIPYIDLKVLTGKKSVKFCKCSKICENEKYDFYWLFMTHPTGFSDSVIRLTKSNPSDIVYIGSHAAFNVLFGNWMIQADQRAYPELNCINLLNGKNRKIKCFGETVGINGHFMQFDFVNNIFVDNNTLIIEVGRYKGDFRNHDENYCGKNDYILRITSMNGDFLIKKIVVNPVFQ